MVRVLPPYQLAFLTPGIKPWSASVRKQMRQTPNFRYTLRGRPHSLQRSSRREENFGSLIALAIFDLLATLFPVFHIGHTTSSPIQAIHQVSGKRAIDDSQGVQSAFLCWVLRLRRR